MTLIRLTPRKPEISTGSNGPLGSVEDLASRKKNFQIWFLHLYEFYLKKVDLRIQFPFKEIQSKHEAKINFVSFETGT